MKKSLFVGALSLALVLTSLYIWRDFLVSRYLSQQSGFPIELHNLCVNQRGEFCFSNLQASGSMDGPLWLRAQKGTLIFRRSRSALAILEGVAFGDLVQKKLSTVSSWLGATTPSPGYFDRVVFLLSPKNAGQQIRVLEAEAHDFRLKGAFHLKDAQLEKMDVRLDFSPALSSAWPADIHRKMIAAGDGWRSIGLLFGGNTWTLRGAQGPLLQFSGRFASNSH